ncbi:MAG: response regulator [Anaeromyxobacter sp.]|nr:response regulator [Anaeromyxobacter sp.]MBL0277085.1 response regulator [Anaeromyxobacter sp.]
MADVAAHLVRTGVLPPEAASRALASAHDGDVASAALRLGLAAEGALVRALATLLDSPGVDLSRSVIPTANLDVVSAGFCRQRRILPVSVGKAELVLAMANPEDSALADELHFVTGRRVLRCVAVPAAIERALDGLVREKQRFAATWRGAQAPALPDPAAAWVGVVHPPRRAGAGLELPDAPEAIELVPANAMLETPFAAPSPARTVRPAQHQPPAAPRGGDVAPTTVRLEGLGAGRLVLVADASPEAREELAGLLGGLGCTVLQAANGRAALDIVREARPDLVITDAMLPMVQGFEVCRAIKGDPVLRPTPVVLTSGQHRGTVAADAQIAFGADAFLEKPFRREEAVRVARVLLLGGAPDPAEARKRAAATAAWRAGAQALKDGRIEEATVLLRDACARDDLSAEAHYYLGHALAKQGLLFEAAAAYGRSAELRPDIDAAHQYLAQLYEQLGFQRSAREAWANAIETCTDVSRKKAMQARLLKLLGL